MHLRKIIFCLTAILLSVAAVCAQTLKPEENIPALIKQCGDNQREMNKRIFEYSWTSRETFRKFNKNGKLEKEKTNVIEVFPREHRPAKVSLNKNGEALSKEDVERERRRAAEELEKDERERLLRDPNAPGGEFGFSYEDGDKAISLNIFNFLRAGKFSSPRRQQYNGRETIILDFEPRPNLPALPRVVASMSVLVGRVWIDAADKVVTRLEAWQPSADSEIFDIKPAVVLEYERQPEGLWLQKSGRIFTGKNPLLFNGVNIEFVFEYDNFQHFETKILEYKIDKTNI